MSLHRGRMRPCFHFQVFYFLLSLFQFIFCNESSFSNIKLQKGNLLVSERRNDERNNERFMLEKLLSNDNQQRYEDVDFDNEINKKKRNILENEKSKIQKLLSLKSVFESEEDNVDPELKKRLWKKNLFVNKDKDSQSIMRNLYNEENSNRNGEVNIDNNDNEAERKKRLLKKRILGNLLSDENSLGEKNFNDFDDDDNDDSSSRVKKILVKKNLNEDVERNEEFENKSLKKRADDEINKEKLEFKKSLSKKVENVDDIKDNGYPEFKKRFSMNDYSNYENGNPELRKRFSNKNENDDITDIGDPELKKKISMNEYNDDDNGDTKFKKRFSKKNENDDDITDTGDPELKKRFSMNEYNDDNGDTEFKKRFAKKNENGDITDIGDPELRKRFSKKNENDDITDTGDPELKKRFSMNEYNDDDNGDTEFKKRFAKKNENSDIINNGDTEFKKRFSMNEYNDDNGEPEFKKRFSNKNGDDDEITDNANPESKKRYKKKSLDSAENLIIPDAMNREAMKYPISDDTDTREADLEKTVRYDKRKRYNEHSYPYDDRAFQSSQSQGELPILKLSPDALIHDVVLDRNDTHHLYWQVDYKSESVRMEVHSRATSSHPWMTIGFSDRGELPGSDVCVFWIDWKNHAHFQNAFVDADGRLVASQTQECRSFRFRFIQGVLKLTFTRRFDTCQPNHYIIERGTTHIIWSWGVGPLYNLDGVLAGGDDNGMVRIELLKPLLAEVSFEGTEEIDITSNSAIVPAEETTYWCTVHKLPERLEEKHHIFKFSPKIHKRNEDIVHHMEVFHCEYPSDFQVPLYEGPCHADDRPKEIDACKRVLAAWAMGALPFTYPEEAGLPFGGDDFNPFVMLEVHYNNPGRIAGRVDSSGMTLTYSRQLRRYDAAIMELGLEYTAKMAVPPRMKRFYLDGYCIPECTAVGLDPDGIFIFGSQLHTHLTGVRAWTKHYRGNRELPELNRDNHYSTHFQEIRRLPFLVHVLPGDALVTTCEHMTLDRAKVTVGGFAISDEMCVNYVHYYPKSDLEVCKSSVDSKTLIDYFQTLKRLELQHTSSELDWRGNYQSIHWTPLRGNFLQELYNESPLSMQCNKSTGERFPGFWENKNVPTVTHTLPIPERECNLRDHFRLNEEIIIV